MVESDKLFNLKKQLRKLESFRGSGTELISVYIPVGSAVHEMSNKLREEMSQASNIKSKSTRTNVLGALEKIMHHLKIFKKAPPNGIAIFAGNISDNPAKIDIELFSLEPPEPLNIGAYRCDSKFFLEPLADMLETKDTYGILAIDGSDSTLAVVRGTNIKIEKKIHSTAHSKVRKGGQSARRYERLIEEQKENYYKKVAEAMDSVFLNKVKGVIVGGPGPIKDYFIDKKYYNYQIKIMGTVDTGYSDEFGVREILSKSEKILVQQEAVKERALVERFIKEVVSDGLATYGAVQVRNAVKSRQAEKVLVSEGLEHVTGFYKCSSCEKEDQKIFRNRADDDIPCKACGAKMKLQKEELLIDEIVELAKENEIEVEIVSTGTTEGAQFLSGFGGIGAFLRYKI